MPKQGNSRSIGDRLWDAAKFWAAGAAAFGGGAQAVTTATALGRQLQLRGVEGVRLPNGNFHGGIQQMGAPYLEFFIIGTILR